MFKQYLKIAWRNQINNPSFSLINISGLAISMAASVLILLWVTHEHSYDQFHENKDRLYQVWNKDISNGKINCWNSTPKVMATVMQKDYGEIEQVTRRSFGNCILFSYADKRINTPYSIVDSGFLKMFSFPLLKGDRTTCLNNPDNIVLTKSFSDKIFGNEDPIGKIVKLDNQYTFTVSAVLKDLPDNTEFKFELLLPWRFLINVTSNDTYWGNNSTSTYILVKPNVSVDQFQSKIKKLREKYDKESPKMETFIYPVSRLRLHGIFENGVETGGRVTLVNIFILVAVFLLLIACINFMNLSTARSEKRSKEVGIRKVVGAHRLSLITQFLSEAIIVTLISGVIALGIVHLSLDAFNQLVGVKLSLDLNDKKFIIWAISFLLFTGIVAGSYPALFLSSFKPVAVLKGIFKTNQSLITPRKILVVSQFTFSVLLIIATLIVRRQVEHAQNRQSGYNKDLLVYHFMEGDIEKNYTSLKNELLQTGLALSVTKTSDPITDGHSYGWGMSWEGKDPNDKTIIDRFYADDAIIKTVGLEVLEGRDFEPGKYPTDSTGAIISESTAALMGFKTPDQAIGKTIHDLGKGWHIIGVIKDFVLHSPFQPTVPIFIGGAKGRFRVLHVKYSRAKPIQHTLAEAEKIFKKYNPEFPFEYSFVDAEYQNKISDEKLISSLSGLFAMLTIFISCLGLFGLVSFMAANRTKELSIRKVLGASISNIVLLLSKDFLKLVAVAFIIASPLAYWAMSRWLSDYPYRTTISWSVFVVAGISVLAIAMFTLGFQAVKAAVTSPVKNMRTE